MVNKLVPSVFIGKIINSSNKLANDYFNALRSFFNNYSESSFLFIESSDEISENDFIFSFEKEFQLSPLLQSIENIISEIDVNKIVNNDFSYVIKKYIEYLDIPGKKVISITLGQKNIQKLMEIGKKLQKIREMNCLPIGLGNLTHSTKKQDEIVLESVKEFDSWVRIKLWEFDYFALRDFETFFPFENNFLDKNIHYSPFAVIFGSLIGTDVLYDIFAGFEDYNSLRSFYFSSLKPNE
jgi:hypothetical protein